MSPITVIPTALALRADAARNPRNAGTCGIFEIAGRLGIADRSVGHIVRTIDAYIAHEAFPVPFPVVRAATLVKTAHKDSSWPRVAVELWFDNRLPPAARAAIDVTERHEIDSRLSASAMRLFSDDAA
jgi:hypothetical protein